MQRDDDHADNVFPVKRRRKQIAPEDITLPKRAGNHDRVQNQCFSDDRDGCCRLAEARCQKAPDQDGAHEKHQELSSGQNALHNSPRRFIPPFTLLFVVDHTRFPVGIGLRA